ncbi:MAG: YitT family protein [Oscillospiraceae bacterium]|nr:YitT family protein [Oscillospiraceae bacterium]
MMFSFAKKQKPWLLDCLLIPLGSLLFAVSVSVFAAPNEIAPGGFTGLATLLNYLLQTPIGSVTMILNVPVILWAMCVIGYKLVIKTIGALFLGSFLIDLLPVWVPPYEGDRLLAAIFAGVLEGLGLALIFLRGGTTGGTVLIARLLSGRFPHVSMGKLLFVIDFVVIAISSVVYRSLESGLYALIVVFVSTKVMDAVLYGLDVGVGKMMFIISDHNEEIAEQILRTKGRGVTFLYAKGAYSKRERTVLFCAVRKFEMPQIRQLVRKIDERAFLIIGEAGQISGEGFQPEVKQDKTFRQLLQKRRK